MWSEQIHGRQSVKREVTARTSRSVLHHALALKTTGDVTTVDGATSRRR